MRIKLTTGCLLFLYCSDRLSVEECLKHSWLDSLTPTISIPSSPEEPNNNHKERHKDENDNNPSEEDHRKIFYVYFLLSIVSLNYARSLTMFIYIVYFRKRV